MANISAYQRIKQGLGNIGGKVKTIAKNIGGKVLNRVEKAVKIQQGFSAPKNDAERKTREQNLQRLKETIDRWKKEHPGQSIPKEFENL